MPRASPVFRASVVAAYSALNAGDLDAFLARTHPDVEFTSIVAEAEGTTFKGHEGVREWWKTVPAAFEGVTWDLLDIRGDDDRGVVRVRMAGRLSGVPVEQHMWQAVRFSGEIATWGAFFRTESEALEAVGLEP
jgi:ketosteroid isomerase-like protein